MNSDKSVLGRAFAVAAGLGLLVFGALQIKVGAMLKRVASVLSEYRFSVLV